MRDADDSERLFRRGLGAILLIAAVLRIVYLTQTLGQPLLRDLLILDSRSYDRMAGLIASGDLAAGEEAFSLGPLYPYFLALLRTLFGEGTGVIYTIQQILGLGNIALTASLARRCFGVRAALVAAALTALYGPMAMLELKVMASTLAVFLSLASLQLLLTARERAWRLAAFVPGWTLGLACLVRPNALLFVPVAALWLLWDGRGFRDAGRRLDPARLPAALLLIAGAVVAIAPATLRNYAVADELIPISTQGGITFYQSNNERAQGLYTRLPGFSGTPADMRGQSRMYAEKDLGRPLRESEVSRYWTRRGLSYLAGNPIDAVKLVGRKLRYWTTSDEHSTEYVVPVERDLVPSLWLMPLPFGVIFALAFLGVRVTGRGRPEHGLLYGFVLVNLAAVLIFYFSSRYRLPAVPVLASFAGCGAVAAFDRFRRSRGGFWIWLGPGLILAVYSLHSWSDHLQSQGAAQLYNYGKVYYQRGLYEPAVEKYREALVTFEKRWPVHLHLGIAYQRLGDHEAALREYERVLELNPAHRVAADLAARAREKLARERR
jgi:4-amino-4-deoxy-L-arabinose transferase-like glycosyltransferase